MYAEAIFLLLKHPTERNTFSRVILSIVELRLLGSLLSFFLANK